MWVFGIGHLLKALRGSLPLLIVVMTVWLLAVPGSCGFIGPRPLLLPAYENWHPLASAPVWTPFPKKEYKKKKITIFRQNYIYLKFQHMLLMLIRILWKTNTFTCKLLGKKSVWVLRFSKCVFTSNVLTDACINKE